MTNEEVAKYASEQMAAELKRLKVECEVTSFIDDETVGIRFAVPFHGSIWPAMAKSEEQQREFVDGLVEQLTSDVERLVIVGVAP